MVAGTARGLRLDVPPGTSTRPTSDRVREAVFNALDSLGAIADARVLDAFAGSGALGVEALSRGAEHVTFAEIDAVARAVVTTNLERTGFAGQASVVGVDGGRLAGTSGPWDLILLDPPYVFDGWEPLLAEVIRGLAPGGIVVMESDREVSLPSTLVGMRSKQYGGTVVGFASPAGDPA